MELAFGTDQKTFAADVRRNFPGADTGTTSEQKARPPGRAVQSFDVTEFDDNDGSYSICIWRGAAPQVAIAYWMQRGQRNAARRAIELSLESFGVNADTAKLRLVFGKRSPWLLEKSK
jgi:hypothetical protein